MIVGTAGHIDHGKTALVRALTGVDTDRLPEERERGISIELGYAYLPIGGEDVLGFVDVPGHEKFIHTMLAGATGIDFALLVVAADDGVMPQTREHLAILDLLGVQAGAIAITKIDAVSQDRIAACEGEVRELTGDMAFCAWPMHAVSSRTGTGIETLRQFLHAQAQRLVRTTGAGRFRLAVDRCFTLPGAGTVAAGTVYSGSVKPGDRLLLASSGAEVRVRELHAQNRPSAIGVAGQRCALSLPGTPREQVQRGDWIVDPAIQVTTDRFDARIRMTGGANALRSGMTVHVHAGAARAGARLVVLDDGEAEHSGILVQVVLQLRMSVWRGDRFVIRDVSAAHTLGGGVVLDPCAPLRYRRTPERLATLRAFELASPLAQLAALVDISPQGVDVSAFARTGNVGEVAKLAESLSVRCLTTPVKCLAISDIAWAQLQEEALATLAEFHAAHPDLVGLDRPRLRRMAFPRLDEALYRAGIDELVAAGRIREGGAWLYLPAHESSLTAQERTLVESITPLLLATPFEPPWLRDLARDSGQREDVLRRAMLGAAKRGDLHQVVRDLFYHPNAIRALAALALDLSDAEGQVLAAAFRDRTGLGRKRAIQVLEFFDRVGFTRRVKDTRTIRAESSLNPSHASVRENLPQEAAQAR